MVCRGKTDYGVLQIDHVYESDFDIVTNNDDEEVTFVDFPLTYEKETTKCNENVKENMKKCCHCSFETKKISNPQTTCATFPWSRFSTRCSTKPRILLVFRM